MGEIIRDQRQVDIEDLTGRAIADIVSLGRRARLARAESLDHISRPVREQIAGWLACWVSLRNLDERAIAKQAGIALRRYRRIARGVCKTLTHDDVVALVNVIRQPLTVRYDAGEPR